MYKTDPKVKKTLVRNCENKVKSTGKKQAVYDVGSTSRVRASKSSNSLKDNALDQPTLCSSEALLQYISDARVSSPPPLSLEDLNVDKEHINAKVTKKLNFHFNDRIYRNLIELNTGIEDSKKKKEKRPNSSATLKRDLEPNIQDFYEEIKDKDSPPNIPIIKPKYKPVKNVERGHLHKLVAKYECL